MKKLNQFATSILSVLCLLAVVLCIIYFLFTNRYVPIRVIQNNLDALYQCKEIAISYVDIKTQEKPITKVVSDDQIIADIIDKTLDTFCWRTRQENLYGGANVTLTFILDNQETIELYGQADGGILVDKHYYATNNLLGIYFSQLASSLPSQED